jgi:hypothetical protein
MPFFFFQKKKKKTILYANTETGTQTSECLAGQEVLGKNMIATSPP